MTPFDKCVAIGLIFAAIIGLILKRCLPEHLWAPLNTGTSLLGGALATGMMASSNTITIRERHPVIPTISRSLVPADRGQTLVLGHDPSTRHKHSSKAKKHRFTRAQKKMLANLQDWKCGWCSRSLPRDVAMFDIDHRIPWHLDPQHLDWPNTANLQAIHPVPCHREKTALERQSRKGHLQDP